jgi:TonB family protein
MNMTNGTNPRRNRWLAGGATLLSLCLLSVWPVAGAKPAPRGSNAAPAPGDRSDGKHQLLGEQNGNLTIQNGGRVRVEMALGDVHVRVGPDGSVRFHNTVEGSSSSSLPNGRSPFVLSAQNGGEGVYISGQTISRKYEGHLWVSLELDVPHNSVLEINTQGGNIDVANMDARVQLQTGGGNLTLGRVGGEARLDSGGGHITVQDVTGDLTASTGGGHITAGRIHGDAVLRTGGGHIRAAAVDGTAHLETGGGNIFLQQAGARLSVSTGGGRIVVGEASGGIQAKTGGGGIRVLRVVGPTDIQSGAGAIFLSHVQGNVRASTASGAITAWLAAPAAPRVPAPGKSVPAPPPVPSPALAGSEFESGNGDIVVYVPRSLGVNIEATLQNSDSYRIDVDPALALKMANGAAGRGAVRLEGAVNGGGPRVRVRADDGNIRLLVADAPEPLQFDEAKFEAELGKSLSSLNNLLDEQSQAIDRYCDKLVHNFEMHFEFKEHSEEMKQYSKEMAREMSQQNREMAREASEHAREMAREAKEMQREMEEQRTEREEISAEDLQQKLAHRVEPVYPERAKRQQLEGSVRLRVTVDAEGRVENVKVLSGSPLFTRAASDAVRQWRFEPTLVDGKPAPVVGEVVVTFRLE